MIRLIVYISLVLSSPTTSFENLKLGAVFALESSSDLSLDLPFSNSLSLLYESEKLAIMRGVGDDELIDFLLFDKNSNHYYLFECSVYDADIDYKISSLALIRKYSSDFIALGELHTVPKLSKRWSYFAVKKEDGEIQRIMREQVDEGFLQYYDDVGMTPLVELEIEDALDCLNKMSIYIE